MAGARGGESDGVGAEQPAAAAPGGDGLGSVVDAHGDLARPRERLDVMGDDPGVMRVADHHRRQRRVREAVQKGPLGELDGRVGESVVGVDDGGGTGEPDGRGGCMPVDLAAARLRRIRRDPRRSVPLLAVGLRRDQRLRDPLRVVRGGVVCDQDLDDQRVKLFELESYVRHCDSVLLVQPLALLRASRSTTTMDSRFRGMMVLAPEMSFPRKPATVRAPVAAVGQGTSGLFARASRPLPSFSRKRESTGTEAAGGTSIQAGIHRIHRDVRFENPSADRGHATRGAHPLDACRGGVPTPTDRSG